MASGDLRGLSGTEITRDGNKLHHFREDFGTGRKTGLEGTDAFSQRRKPTTAIESVVETQYAVCACSPLGRVKQVSQPYKPGDPVYWTVYTFDALGRTTRVDLPGGTGFTTTSYSGNTVTVTDPVSLLTRPAHFAHQKWPTPEALRGRIFCVSECERRSPSRRLFLHSRLQSVSSSPYPAV